MEQGPTVFIDSKKSAIQLSKMNFQLTAFVFCLSVCYGAYAPDNCKAWKAAFPDAPTGEYIVSNKNGQTHKVYCEFYNTYGYMFIPEDIDDVDVDMDRLNPDTNEVLVRHRRTDGKQYEVKLSQFSSYLNEPLSIQYSANINYANTNNGFQQFLGKNFLYLGFLKKSIAQVQGSTQGYRVDNTDYTFINCDGNPNSYLAFFFKKGNAKLSDYHTTCNCASALMNRMITESRPTSLTLPVDYFFQTEMHMGGCGGYVVSGQQSQSHVTGAALGMKFAL